MKVRPTTWFNTDEQREKFGIEVHHHGKWYHAALDGEALMFDTEEERNTKMEELKEKELPG